MESLQSHPATKAKTLRQIFDYDMYEFQKVARVPVM